MKFIIVFDKEEKKSFEILVGLSDGKKIQNTACYVIEQEMYIKKILKIKISSQFSKPVL